LRFLENLYNSALTGLRRQVLQNAATSIVATVRGGGAVAVLAFVSASLEAFFAFQALVSLVSTIVFGTLTYRSLPQPELPPRFSRRLLGNVWRFAGGMLLITLLSVLLTQVDKMLLSKLLPLAE